MKGNKGEWSEIYTLLKLLSIGKLYEANADLTKKDNAFYNIIKILRNEAVGKVEFVIDCNNKLVEICNIDNNNLLVSMSMDTFKFEADKLLREIKNNQNSAFELPETESFMNSVFCSKIKAPTSDKSDITIKYLDSGNQTHPEVGFSIKSRLGKPSTLLNAGKTTNFTYKLLGVDDNRMQIFNDSPAAFKIKFDQLNCNVDFFDIDNKTFKNNLIIIDGNLPEISSYLLLQHYLFKNSKLINAITEVDNQNPCGFDVQSGLKFYEHKVKRLLTESALGMVPSKPWNGTAKANGGYIIVREDGEVLCYHLYNRNDFEDYLLSNTEFETPSRKKHGYGYIYKIEEEFFIKLNMQIRFLK